ncbi:MAG: host nuclease inhibitor protein [Caenispirillum sp.]|nr:host nuclease inhibitor protein [Caenispirillum sp.]
MAKKLPAGHVYAACYASGQVVFRRTLPQGLLPIVSGPEQAVRDEMSVACRTAYDGKTLLVPGVPEAPDQGIALDALQTFCRWRAKSADGKGLTYSLGGSNG